MRTRVNSFAERHPVWFGVIATVVWVGLVLGSLRLPPHALYGPMYVNAIGLAAGLLVVRVLGWPRQAGLLPGRSGHARWLVVPLLALTVTYARPGISAAAYLGDDVASSDAGYILACAALSCLLIGLNEELWSRGIILHPLRRLGPFPSAIAVALLFANQHWLNYLAFGADLDDQLAQLVSSGAFAFVLVALRWHGVTIWGLAVLHGLGDFLQLASPGAAAWWWQLAIALFELAYGWWLLRRVPADRRVVQPAADPAGQRV